MAGGYIQSLRARGLRFLAEKRCRACGDELAPSSERFCQKHIDDMARSQRELRARRRRAGLCICCDRLAVFGVFCAKHLVMNRRRGAAYRAAR